MARRILLVGLLLFSAAPAGAASFRILGSTLNGGMASATDVSPDGSSVVYYLVGPGVNGTIHRDVGGSSTIVVSGESIIAGGISGDGSIVVGGRSEPGSGYQQAFRWHDGSLETFGYFTLAALDISADGSTIVGVGGSGAFMYADGKVTYIPLPGPYVRYGGAAYGVSGDGSVIVGHDTQLSEAFRWERDVGIMGLGDLAGGGFSSAAYGVTVDGSVIVGRGTGPSGGEAFRWENGVMTGLGQLGGLPTIARAVSADGSTIVGYADDGEYGGGVATIWDAQHGMRDLKAVLEQEFGLDLSHVQLDIAMGISSDGVTIVGSGRQFFNNGPIAWVATLPEPGSAPVLCLGVLGLAAARRRRPN